MKRKAILIFNDGGPENYLPGIKVDKENYQFFLTSPEGGGWGNDEMKIYHNNCTKGGLECYIKTYKYDRNKPDYWLIIFCGHAYTNHNKLILELSPGNECPIEDIKNILSYSRCLFITDCCRVCIQGITESYLNRTFFSSCQNQTNDYINKCRNLYNDALKKVPQNTFNIIYSTSINQCAQENDEIGGYYSFELLSIARQYKMINRANDSILYIKNAHDIAKKNILEKSKNTQNPTYDGDSLDIIPFVVVPI